MRTINLPPPCCTLTVPDEHIQAAQDGVPIRYIGTTELGKLYFIACIDERPSALGGIEKFWLATPISHETMDAVLHHQIDLRTALCTSCTDEYYGFWIHDRKNGYRLSCNMRLWQIEEDKLPRSTLFWRGQ